MQMLHGRPGLGRLQRIILFYAVAVLALLGTAPCFAYLTAPLVPTYISPCTSGGPCAVGQPLRVTTTPVTGTGSNAGVTISTFIDYVYQISTSGGSPAYISACTTVPACLVGQNYRITSAPVTGTGTNAGVVISAFLGYFNTTQVAGTVPVYVAGCGTQVTCNVGQSFRITNAPITGTGPNAGKTFTTFIGYTYPAIPASTSNTLTPKYFIGSVVYVPPGQGPSSIAYSTGTVTGSTVTTTDSWSSTSSAGGSIGAASVSFADTFGGSTATSTDMGITATQTTSYHGPATNSLNHDYDQIVVFLGVKVLATVDYLGNVTWALDFSQVASSGFATNGYPISVGCLRSGSTISADLCTAMVNFLTSEGITSADYPSILGADPFWNPAASQSPAANRFVLIDAVNFIPNPTTSTNMYVLSNNLTTSNTTTTSYSYSVTAGGSIAALKVSGMLTFSHMSSLLNKTGSTASDTFTLSLPSSPYSGPSTLFVYVDTIYKTFMFSFVQ